MRGDIGEDAPVLRLLEVPCRARGWIGAVRSQPDGLHYLADRPGVDQLARLDAGVVVQPLAEADRINAPGFRLHLADMLQLFQGDDSGLIAHVIFAVLHHPHAQRGALDVDPRADNQF